MSGDTSQERILKAAYACFERYGISKTTIEDIAATANVSRPTVYKYYGSKSDIVEEIGRIESVKVTMQVRRRIPKDATAEQTLTEALFWIVKVASKNEYVQRAIASPEVPSRAADPDGAYHALVSGWWKKFLEQGISSGELADDLSPDEMIAWLIPSMTLLLVKVSSVTVKDADLRQFIRRFVVRPLLKQ